MLRTAIDKTTNQFNNAISSGKLSSEINHILERSIKRLNKLKNIDEQEETQNLAKQYNIIIVGTIFMAKFANHGSIDVQRNNEQISSEHEQMTFGDFLTICDIEIFTTNPNSKMFDQLVDQVGTAVLEKRALPICSPTSSFTELEIEISDLYYANTLNQAHKAFTDVFSLFAKNNSIIVSTIDAQKEQTIKLFDVLDNTNKIASEAKTILQTGLTLLKTTPHINQLTLDQIVLGTLLLTFARHDWKYTMPDNHLGVPLIADKLKTLWEHPPLGMTTVDQLIPYIGKQVLIDKTIPFTFDDTFSSNPVVNGIIKGNWPFNDTHFESYGIKKMSLTVKC